MKLKAEDKAKLQEIDQLNAYEWFVTVTKLVSGDSFGELALLTDEPRAATITCVS